MAKVVQATSTDVTVNYDGWSEKWNYVSIQDKLFYDTTHAKLYNVLFLDFLTWP